MSKINSNKSTDFEPLRTNRQSDVKQTKKNEILSAKDNPVVGSDKVIFSDRAAEAGKLLENLRDLPDVREAKVESLREQISAGQFNPSAETIADAILKDEEGE